jgi:3-hydroxyisobutyrate dehydrogenase-like beta-hydroxyacid dehydrogenase
VSQILALIGFGEAARTFADAAGWNAAARAFDVKTLDPNHREAKLADYAASGVRSCESASAALHQATLALSLVTADQACAAAIDAAMAIPAGALFCDMNSVAPDTKRAAAEAIEAAGGRYVDVAVMGPVSPAQLAVPLLVAGPHAEAGAQALREAGFTRIAIAGGTIGAASAVKMIRSVMVKGIEALTAECVIAADRAGVADAVLASLGDEWPAMADYNLGRMLSHGARRAAEMEETARTLEGLGVAPIMTRGTIERQRALGGLGLVPPPDGLAAKLAAIEEAAA